MMICLEKRRIDFCVFWSPCSQWGTSSWGKCLLHPLCLPRVSFNNLILKLILMILWEKLVYHLKDLYTTTHYMTLSCGVCCAHVGVRSLGDMADWQMQTKTQTKSNLSKLQTEVSKTESKHEQNKADLCSDFRRRLGGQASQRELSLSRSLTENLRFCCNAGFDGRFSNP